MREIEKKVTRKLTPKEREAAIELFDKLTRVLDQSGGSTAFVVLMAVRMLASDVERKCRESVKRDKNVKGVAL